MPTFSLAAPWVRDLPVCFPGRPCVDYSPYEADAINITTTLTPISQAIAIACFVVAGTTLVLVTFGLRRTLRHPSPSLWQIALSAALLITGAIVVGIVSLRSSALSAAYGVGGSAGPNFYGSWWLVSLAGDAMASVGLAALVAIALIAVLRLKALNETRSTRA